MHSIVIGASFVVAKKVKSIHHPCQENQRQMSALLNN